MIKKVEMQLTKTNRYKSPELVLAAICRSRAAILTVLRHGVIAKSIVVAWLSVMISSQS